jgi:hypothetical protein
MSFLRHLTRFEIDSAKAAMIAIFPGSDGIASMDIEGYLTDTLKRIPLEPVLGIRAAIWIVALAPIFVLRRARTLAGLASSDRELVMVALATNRVYAVRQLVLALKALAALLYAGSPTVRARLMAPTISASFVDEARLVRRLPSLPPSTTAAPVVASAPQKEKSHAALA